MYNKLLNILIFITAVFIIGVVVDLSSLHAFYGDDYTYGLLNYNEGIFDCLYKTAGFEHGGGYFSLFLDKFFSFGLPYLLHIHPADFMRWGEGLFQGIITVLLCLSFIKFFSESKNNKFFFLSLFIFFGISYFYIITLSESYYSLTGHDNFYRYQTTLLFFNIFVYNLYSNIISKNNKFNILNFILTVFALIFIGGNNEYIIEVICITVFEIILYNIIIKIISLKKKELKSFLLNLDINFYIPLVLFFISAVRFTTSHGFLVQTSLRIPLNYNEIILNANQFLKDFIKLYICDTWIYWVIFIIILIFSLYTAYKKSEQNEVFIPVFIHMANIISIISLIIGAKTNNGYSWIFRPTVQYTFHMIFFTVFILLIAYIIKSMAPAVKSKLINGISVFIIILSVLMIPKLKYINEIKQTDISIVYNKYAYIGEKMLRFYYLKNKTPYLINFDYKKYAIEDYPSLYSKIDFVKTPDLCTKENLYTLTYYPKIYKDNKSIELGLCYSDDALERFYKEGGQFTKAEFEHIIFSRLLDDDFVLNRNLTPKEIEDNYLKPTEVE